MFGEEEPEGVEKLLLTSEEVAAMLNCHVRTLEKLYKRGDMPKPLRIGGMVRWRREEINEWIIGGCKPLHRKEIGDGDE